MYTHTYTYTHAYMYTHTCSYTRIHVHIYAHTYNMYIYTHASTPGTMSQHQLREKPDFTPGSSVLRPVRCNSEGSCFPWPAAQLTCSRGTTDKRRTTTINSTSPHNHDFSLPRPHLVRNQFTRSMAALTAGHGDHASGFSSQAIFAPFLDFFIKFPVICARLEEQNHGMICFQINGRSINHAEIVRSEYT